MPENILNFVFKLRKLLGGVFKTYLINQAGYHRTLENKATLTVLMFFLSDCSCGTTVYVVGDQDPATSIDGTYEMEFCTFNERPTYMHENGLYYIFYDNTTLSWYIGRAIGHISIAYYFINDNSPMPCNILPDMKWTYMIDASESNIIVSCNGKWIVYFLYIL